MQPWRAQCAENICGTPTCLRLHICFFFKGRCWLAEFDLSGAEKTKNVLSMCSESPSNAMANRFHAQNALAGAADFDMALSVSLIEDRTMNMLLTENILGKKLYSGSWLKYVH